MSRLEADSNIIRVVLRYLADDLAKHSPGASLQFDAVNTPGPYTSSIDDMLLVPPQDYNLAVPTGAQFTDQVYKDKYVYIDYNANASTIFMTSLAM